MKKHVYVDFSNLYVEARHLAAVFSGMVLNIEQAQDERRTAYWRCDYARLLEILCPGVHADTAFLVTTEPFPDAHIAEWCGFEVQVYPRGYAQREKCVDTHFAIRVAIDSTRFDPKRDEITLVTGDLDQLPTVNYLRAQGFKVRVVFWDHASQGLRKAATSFESLNPYWSLVTFAGPRSKAV